MRGDGLVLFAAAMKTQLHSGPHPTVATITLCICVIPRLVSSTSIAATRCRHLHRPCRHSRRRRSLIDLMYNAELEFTELLLGDWGVRTENPWEGGSSTAR